MEILLNDACISANYDDDDHAFAFHLRCDTDDEGMIYFALEPRDGSDHYLGVNVPIPDLLEALNALGVSLQEKPNG